MNSDGTKKCVKKKKEYISIAQHNLIVHRLQMLNDEQFATIQILSERLKEYEAMSKVKRIDLKTGTWV